MPGILSGVILLKRNAFKTKTSQLQEHSQKFAIAENLLRLSPLPSALRVRELKYVTYSKSFRWSFLEFQMLVISLSRKSPNGY